MNREMQIEDILTADMWWYGWYDSTLKQWLWLSSTPL